MKANKAIFAILSVCVLIGIAVYLAVTLFGGVGGPQYDEAEARAMMEQYMKKISVTEAKLIRGDLSFSDTSLADTLPDIDKYPLQVKPSTNVYIEIMTSTEKATVSADAPNDKWLVEVAEKFNRSGVTVDGVPVSVAIRAVASGVAKDYIVSGKHVPHVFTPSNEIWGDSIAAEGIEINLVKKRMAGNTAGIVLTKDAHKRITDKYGEITVAAVNKAVGDGELSFGYTNPFASSVGMNMLLSTLYAASPGDIFSDAAVNAFEKFQANVRFTAYTTLQMTASAATGRLEGFVSESQQFKNSKDLQSYVFTPFGVRHDSPVYTLGGLSGAQQGALDEFLRFCDSKENQDLATKYGFNQYENYAGENMDGSGASRAQKLWKEKKNGSLDVVALFVCDLSGSMDGSPINSVRRALLNNMQYIGETSHVGILTFSDKVQIALPLARFDFDQMEYYAGAVQDMRAGGSTALYDAVTAGCQVLMDYRDANPNTRPIMFILSDGERTSGLTYRQIERMAAGLGIPINTISYNGKFPELESLSNLNEAACISADDEDVMYKLAAFFNAEF